MKIWLYEKLERIQKDLDDIKKALVIVVEKENHMSAELDALTLEVAETRGMVDSAVLLLQGLSEYIRSHANDPLAMYALAADLDAQQAILTAAIAANPVPVTPP